MLCFFFALSFFFSHQPPRFQVFMERSKLQNELVSEGFGYFQPFHSSLMERELRLRDLWSRDPFGLGQGRVLPSFDRGNLHTGMDFAGPLEPHAYLEPWNFLPLEGDKGMKIYFGDVIVPGKLHSIKDGGLNQPPSQPGKLGDLLRFLVKQTTIRRIDVGPYEIHLYGPPFEMQTTFMEGYRTIVKSSH